MKLIERLFVRTTTSVYYTRSLSSSDPATVSRRPEPLSNIQPQSIDAVAGIAK